METPVNSSTNLTVPSTPLKSNWLFEPNIYELTPFRKLTNELFCVPRDVSFEYGWDTKLFDAVKQANKAGYTTLTIEFTPVILTCYDDILKIINYNFSLEENKEDIERVKFCLISQTRSEIQISNCITQLDKIIDIMDILEYFNCYVRIYF